MNILTNILNILTEVADFVFSPSSDNPIFYVLGALIVTIVVFGTLKYLIKGL